MTNTAKRLGNEFLVNTEGNADQVFPAIARLASGGFVVTWITTDSTQDGDGRGVKAQVFNATGGKVGSEFLVNAEGVGDQDAPTVAGLNNGGFVITWWTQDNTQDGDGTAIKAQRFNAAGDKVGGEFLVNAEDAGNQTYSSITALANGGFVVCWSSSDTTQDGSSWAIKAQVFNAAGVKVGIEFLVNTEGDEEQGGVAVAALANGGFVATWVTVDATQDGDGRAIKAQVFSASGAKVGSEMLVNSEGDLDQYAPTIAGLSNGGFVISWETADPSQDGDGFAIKGQVFSAAGVKVDGEFLVNTWTVEGQYDPTIAGLADGGFVISWETYNSAADGDGAAIKAQVFDAAGAKVGSEFLVNSQGAYGQFDATVAGLSGGGFVIGWDTGDPSADGDGFAIKAQVFELAPPPTPVDPEPAAYASVGAEIAVNTETANDQTLPAVAGLADGGFVVTWTTVDPVQDGDGRAIKAQLFDAAGEKAGDEFLVNSESAGNQDDATVTALSDGGFVISWMTWDAEQDGELTAIKAQRFDAAGAKVGDELLINTDGANYQAYPSITALDNGGFVVSWTTWNEARDESGLAIIAQVFDAAGAKVGGEFVVNSDGVGYQEYSVLTGLAGGGFVISWHSSDVAQDGSEYAIKAQVFDAAGTRIGGEFLVNSAGVDDQGYPAIAALDNGGFVVSWTTYDTIDDGSESAIKAQVFDATGGKVGGEFLVNAEVAGEQTFPTITGLADGGFVVSWQTGDPAQDGAGWAIKAQAFDATGNRLGDEFLVNTDGASNQVTPAIASLSDGGFVISWVKDDPAVEGDAEIRAQVFGVHASNAMPVGVDDDAMTSAGTPVVIDVLANDSDADDDDLSVASVGEPEHGGVVINEDGTLTYTPDSGFSGVDSFDYTVSDGNGGSDTATVTIEVSEVTIPNAIPVAVNDSAATAPGAAVVIDVLANDSDEDDDDLNVVSASEPNHGSVVVNEDGTVTYTPDSGFTGTDSFDYTVSDGNGGSATGSVTVQVSSENHVPSLEAIAPLTTLAGTGILLTAEADDPDGDALTFATTTPAHGQTTVAADGRIVYTPEAGFTGNDSFVINVADGRGGTASTTVEVSVVAPDNGRDWQLKTSSGFAGEIGGTGLVSGTNGLEDITVLDLPGKVTFDPSFNRGGDLIRLDGAAEAWHVALTGSSALFSDGDTVVTVPVGVDGVTVAFDDGGRVLRYDADVGAPLIGTQAITSVLAPVASAASDDPLPDVANPDAVARLFLAPDASATLGGKVTVFGTGGSEDVHVVSGQVTLDPSFNRGGDHLALNEDAGEFTARLSGSNIVLDGGNVDVVIPVGMAGMTIGFADGDQILRYDPELQAVLIGTTQIGTSSTPLTDFA